MKMEKTFSYRRQEILKGEPLIADFKSRWPALFTAREVIVLCVLTFVVVMF